MGMKQDVEALFFGSGVQELYEHWKSQIPGQGSLFQRHGEWQPGEAPDTWAYQITATNPLNSERLLRKVITYQVLYTAAELVTAEKVDTAKPFSPVSAATDRACSGWVFTDELDGFDPFTIDELLQIAVFGGVWNPHFKQRDTTS